MRTIKLAVILWMVGGCASSVSSRDDLPARDPMTKTSEPIPDHLKHFPGLSVRIGDRIVAAPDADVAVAQGYPTEPAKGAWADGRRITIMTSALRVRADQPVRIVHVVESTRAGDSLHVMGPKAVLGERVDGKLVTAATASTGDPLMPTEDYDGRVQPAPAVDYNYDVTEYRLPVGRPTIEWQLGPLRSNQLAIDVVP